MSTQSMAPLAGQATLIGSWHALAQISAGAKLAHTKVAVAAVFPSWAPLNNAILLDQTDPRASVGQVAELYTRAGVESWALWLPSPATSLDEPSHLDELDGMKLESATLVMRLPLPQLPQALREHDGVVRTSVAAAARASDEPVPADDLDEPDPSCRIDGWVMVDGSSAVAGAWSYLHGTDCGIYAVGTVPEWRRRGLARALMLHVLSDAYRRGARTATLQSTAMGQSLYTSLGFSVVGRYEEWVPA